MKLALIAPLDLLGVAKAFAPDYHLLLPHLFVNKSYKEYAASLEGFVILDNGAAEGYEYGMGALQELATKFGVDEIVLPDEIGDRNLTVSYAREAEEYADVSKFDYMGVAQGQSLEEVKSCIEAFAQLPYINTVGIPRHLVTTLNSKYVRLELPVWIFAEFGDRFDVHLLGAAPTFVDELFEVQRFYGDLIRGMDTSMPFVYAQESAEMRQSNAPAIKRRLDYFDARLEDFDIRALLQNLRTMRGWLDG